MSRATHPELLYQIALTMAPDVGPKTARKLISKAGSASRIFALTKASLEKIEGIGPRLSSAIHPSLLHKAEKEMGFIERYGISVHYMKDPDYPQRLKECTDAPILIYASGTEGLNSKRALSVVGTRKASSYGKEICRKLVLELGEILEDLVIISGLAYGIDVIAHRAALEGGLPTVAVLGHGLGTIYPYAHRDTAKKISRQGALLTDFHSSTGPERNNFLRRNRIIAGMSDATLVVESAATGGALTTARMAHSYGRDLLAVPGRTVDQRSRGCNKLIRYQMAALVESAQDVLYHLNWNSDKPGKEASMLHPKVIKPEEKILLDLIQRHHPVGPGDLSIQSGYPIQRVVSLLTEMELKQWVAVEPGNLYQCRLLKS